MGLDLCSATSTHLAEGHNNVHGYYVGGRSKAYKLRTLLDDSRPVPHPIPSHLLCPYPELVVYLYHGKRECTGSKDAEGVCPGVRILAEVSAANPSAAAPTRHQWPSQPNKRICTLATSPRRYAQTPGLGAVSAPAANGQQNAWGRRESAQLSAKQGARCERWHRRQGLLVVPDIFLLVLIPLSSAYCSITTPGAHPSRAPLLSLSPPFRHSPTHTHHSSPALVPATAWRVPSHPRCSLTSLLLRRCGG
ncbi:hypothetical protein B0H14DRAFT_2793885 [Mycena olivaceomarginata]|nr:hypothetical protein B0H14DRAFT_2793885 [Mycena olivaceomarginata]